MNDDTRRQALVVMAKRPSPGSTKTRLTPPLTPESAAALYECFLLDALDLARSIPGVTPLIAVSPPDATEYFRTIAPDVRQVPQLGTSLADRLCHVLTQCLEDRYDNVVAVNSDSPTLPSSLVIEAFERLSDETVDMVLGPTDDGGYYLIGWKRAYPELVRGVTMSTPHVLRDTLDLATASDVSVSLLETWYDVDEPADLDRLGTDLAASPERGHITRKFLEKRHQAAC